MKETHEVRGVTGTIADLARHFQIPAQIVYVRKSGGMTLEDALTKPYKPVGKQKFLQPPGKPPEPPKPQLVPDPDPHGRVAASVVAPLPSPVVALRGPELPPGVTDAHVQLWKELTTVDMRLAGLTAERARILENLRKLPQVD